MQYSLVNFDPGLIPGKEACGYEHCMFGCPPQRWMCQEWMTHH